MKNAIFTLFLALGAWLFTNEAHAQCTPICGGGWGAWQELTLQNQTLMAGSSCTYTFYYRYQEQVCNPTTVEVRFEVMAIRSNCHTGQLLQNCAFSKAMLMKAFTLHRGKKVIANMDWSCCATIEVELPNNGDFCFIDLYNPPTNSNRGFVIAPCGSISCCKTSYEKVGPNLVQYQTINSQPANCVNMPAPPYFLIHCGGIPTKIYPVGSGPIPCYTACPPGSSGVYKTDVGTSVKTDSETDNAFKMYPNPSREEITFEYDSKRYGQMAIEIFDVQGRLIFQKDISEQMSNTIKINVSDWSKGVYFIKVNNDAGLVHSQSFEVIE